jgi:hypothetical protein
LDLLSEYDCPQGQLTCWENEGEVRKVIAVRTPKNQPCSSAVVAVCESGCLLSKEKAVPGCIAPDCFAYAYDVVPERLCVHQSDNSHIVVVPATSPNDNSTSALETCDEGFQCHEGRIYKCGKPTSALCKKGCSGAGSVAAYAPEQAAAEILCE